MIDTYDAALSQAKEHFDQATIEHEMTVLHDDGLYRHLRFAKPGCPVLLV